MFTKGSEVDDIAWHLHIIFSFYLFSQNYTLENASWEALLKCFGHIYNIFFYFLFFVALKAKEILIHDGPLVVPYSVQETLPKPESVQCQPEKTLLRVQVPPPSPSSSELTPREDPVSTGDEDCAHSYVEEINLENDQSIETKNKRLFRRFVCLLLYFTLLFTKV